MKLSCPQDGFERLHAAVDAAKRNTKRITVEKADLKALLMDHSDLITKLKELGINVDT